MATRDQVLQLLELGHSYESVARELDLPPGLAYMIATGQPADGSGAQPSGSPQRLVNPPAFNPTRKAHIMDWVRQRAARDLTEP